jgi:hypothetical protein
MQNLMLKAEVIPMSKARNTKPIISTLNRPIYRDINTCKDNSIEILLSKDRVGKELEEIVGVDDSDKLERLAAFLLKLYALK